MEGLNPQMPKNPKSWCEGVSKLYSWGKLVFYQNKQKQSLYFELMKFYTIISKLIEII